MSLLLTKPDVEVRKVRTGRMLELVVVDFRSCLISITRITSQQLLYVVPQNRALALQKKLLEGLFFVYDAALRGVKYALRKAARGEGGCV